MTVQLIPVLADYMTSTIMKSIWHWVDYLLWGNASPAQPQSCETQRPSCTSSKISINTRTNTEELIYHHNRDILNAELLTLMAACVTTCERSLQFSLLSLDIYAERKVPRLRKAQNSQRQSMKLDIKTKTLTGQKYTRRI